MSEPAICYTYPQPLTQKSATSPGSNFNQQGGSIFNRRRHSSHPEVLITKGRIVLGVLQRQIDSALRKELRPVTLCGFQGLATNAIGNTSEIGHAIATKSGTFGMTYFIKGDEVICSLRSIAPFDVSAIATQFGGGGHAQASGFTVPIAKFFSEIW